MTKFSLWPRFSIWCQGWQLACRDSYVTWGKFYSVMA